MIERKNTSHVEVEEATALRLKTIAGLLDLPIARFFDATVSQTHRDVMELLRLWQKLQTDEDRASALNYLRWLAVDSGD